MNEEFTTLSNTSRATLNARVSSGVCVVFPQQSLPLGCSPATARVGIEIGGSHALLHVDRSVRYAGPDLEVRQWIVSGTKRFSSADQASVWLSRRVQAAPSLLARPALAVPADITALHEVVGPVARVPTPAALAEGLAMGLAGHRTVIDALAQGAAQHVAKPFSRRPWSVVLMGPTGVGKTSIAEGLARALKAESGGGWPMLRLDMAEMSERHSVARLTGAPPGYVGYGDPSLASALSDEPRHVVLCDEMEKAHPEVVLALMNLLDAGRLDSTRHGSVTAEQSIVLFTTNLGATSLHPSGDLEADDRAGRTALLASGLRPEVVGRFGRVVVLGELADSDLAQAATHSVTRVAADYGCVVDRIDSAFLTGFLGRAAELHLGIRGLEHLADRELGPGLSRAVGGHIRLVAPAPHVVPAGQPDVTVPEPSSSGED